MDRRTINTMNNDASGLESRIFITAGQRPAETKTQLSTACWLLATICCLLLTACTGNPLPLNVMTFNIRYDNPDDSLNNWQYRKDVAADMIKAYDIDLLGTQEVLFNQLNDLKARLPQYAAIGVGRADGKEDGEYCTIFYKKARFTEEESGTFWLSETPELAGSKGWDGACERIATWAILKEQSSGKRLFFINTHLDHIGKTARREGVKLLLERAKQLAVGSLQSAVDTAHCQLRLATANLPLPVIVTGDFNASPQSEPIQQVLADGTFFDSRLKAVGSRSFQSAVDTAHCQLHTADCQLKGTFHGFGKIPLERRQIIDYIFITGDIAVNSYTPLPEKRDGVFLSDHTPVHVNIIIN
jgi:endonuclease/exonuclease/phosphatase family metal-dependent hydrolase